MKLPVLMISLIMAVLLAGCSVSNRTSEGLYRLDTRLSAHAGGGHGGIVENTHMGIIPNASADAFTGATSYGLQGGIHALFPAGMHSVETGLDFFRNGQEFVYDDPANGYEGVRTITTMQFRIPLTYTWTLFRKYHTSGWLQLRTGVSAGYSLFSVNDQSETLPDYQTRPFTAGPLIGATVQPLHFKGNAALGMHLEMFWSVLQAYEDYYNKGDMPSMSYLKFGLSYTLPVSGLFRKFR